MKKTCDNQVTTGHARGRHAMANFPCPNVAITVSLLAQDVCGITLNHFTPLYKRGFDSSRTSALRGLMADSSVSLKILESHRMPDKNGVWLLPAPTQAANATCPARRNSARPNGAWYWRRQAKRILPRQRFRWKSFAGYIGCPSTRIFAVKVKVRMMPRI